MVFMGERRAKQRHNPIAHDLVHGAFIAVHGRHHAFQHWVENRSRVFGIAIGQELHRAFHVGEEHGDLLALAFQGSFGGEDFLGQMAGGVGEWGTRLVDGRGRSWRRRRTGFSDPDQATAVVIDHVGVCVENFVLERLQVVVVQTELQREGTIGHAASALEHRQRLIENLLEGHGRPSTTLAMMPGEKSVTVGSLGKAHREYTRNLEAWPEKLHCPAETLAWELSATGAPVPNELKGTPPAVTFARYPLNTCHHTRG